MTPEDLAVIRARDDAYMSGGPALTDEKMDAAMRSSADRHRLLVEVDRLLDIVDAQEDSVRLAQSSVRGCEGRLARALPVIEAARKVLEDRPSYRLSLSVAEQGLSAALVNFDKESE